MNVITEDEIRQKLSKHYGGYNRDELVGNERSDGHTEETGSTVYSLEGSPPKGYAIVIPELRKVNLYDHKGKRFMILDETIVHELDEKNR